MWPGCYFKYQNMDPTYRFDEYNATRKNQERINEMIKWFKDPQKPANLVMMYYEEPDAEAHAYGADGPLVSLILIFFFFNTKQKIEISFFFFFEFPFRSIKNLLKWMISLMVFKKHWNQMVWPIRI